MFPFTRLQFWGYPVFDPQPCWPFNPNPPEATLIRSPKGQRDLPNPSPPPPPPGFWVRDTPLQEGAHMPSERADFSVVSFFDETPAAVDDALAVRSSSCPGQKDASIT